jgi:hypothetical protein
MFPNEEIQSANWAKRMAEGLPVALSFWPPLFQMRRRHMRLLQANGLIMPGRVELCAAQQSRIVDREQARLV